MTTKPPDPKPLPALAIVAAVLVLAGAFTAVFVLGRTKHDPSQSKGSSPTSQMSSASDADPLRGSPEKDNKFLWRLTAEGLQLQRSNGAAINDARHVCARFLGGESKDQIIQDILQGSAGMSVDTATDFAGTAIDVYCPDGHPDDPGRPSALLTVAGQEVAQPLDGVGEVARPRQRHDPQVIRCGPIESGALSDQDLLRQQQI
ncbi:MAG: hypothetical protein QOG95_3901 [Mycobacterium sp.]|nr:hypothetical protein [Mycobacterium sp.]